MKRTKKKPAPIARWSPTLRKLTAISVRQPWAWLIVNGYKDIENRIWGTSTRGPVLIHAGQKQPTGELMDEIETKHRLKIPNNEMVFGGIVGVVEITDCVTKHPSPWFAGQDFGWVLAKARPLPFKPCLGKLKFFHPDF